MLSAPAVPVLGSLAQPVPQRSRRIFLFPFLACDPGFENAHVLGFLLDEFLRHVADLGILRRAGDLVVELEGPLFPA